MTLYDAGPDARIIGEPRTFLTMELVHGPDLHTSVGRGPLAPSLVAGIGGGLASALDSIHGRG
ncbi:hypothetical protein B5P43_36480 [Bacillus sp. SRB_336]|nr:hypothetical protein B5P43_36480 [Bacillus sp. SRB_336]